MHSKIYLATVIGSGSEADPYRAAVANHPVSHSALIPSNPDGTPRFGWCLVLADAADLSAVDADPACDGFPLGSLDTTVGELSATARNRLNGALTRRGIDPVALGVTSATTLRQIVRWIVAHLDNLVREDAMDAGRL